MVTFLNILNHFYFIIKKRRNFLSKNRNFNFVVALFVVILLKIIIFEKPRSDNSDIT